MLEVVEFSMDEAIDSTADPAVLDKTWEVTKIRMKEEDDRINQARDRASKYMTYTLSLFTLAMALLGLFREQFASLFARSGNHVEGVIALIEISMFAIIVGFLIRALHFSSRVIESRNWKTWNKQDVGRVELGSGEAMYFRYIIKAAWKLIDGNSRLTDNLHSDLVISIQALRRAVLALIFFVLIGIVGIGLGHDSEKNISTGVESMAGHQNNPPKPAQTPQPKPTPSPTPTVGSPLQKGDDLPKK
jgi:hypothetical protein